MKVWIVTEFYDWEMAATAWATLTAAEQYACELWKTYIRVAGGNYPESASLEEYEAAAAACSADYGVMIQVEGREVLDSPPAST